MDTASTFVAAPTTLADSIVSIDAAEADGARLSLTSEQTEILDRAMLRLLAGDESATIAVAGILHHTITVPSYRVDDVLGSVEKLVAKAMKRGLPVPRVTAVGTETRGEGEHAQEWTTLRLLGAAPTFRGWSLIASIAVDTLSDGTQVPLVYTAAGQTCPVDCIDAPTRCQHCNTNRRRSLTLVLRHDNGEVKQVGSTCVDEYVGSGALEAWFVWSKLSEIVASTRGCGVDYNYAELAAWRARVALAQEKARKAAIAARMPERASSRAIPLPLFLAAVIAEVREHGFRSASEARRLRSELDLADPNWDAQYAAAEATGLKVWTAMQIVEHVSPSEADLARAEQIIAWIPSIRDYDGRGFVNEWAHSLKASYHYADRKGVSDGDANTLASAVSAYAKHEAREAQLAQLRNEHVPGVRRGDVIAIEVTVKRDLRWALSCSDTDGRQIMTRTATTVTGQVPAVGARLLLVGKVGDLSDYQGTKQTFVNAGKLYSLPVTKPLPAAARKIVRAWSESRGLECPAYGFEPAKAAKRSRKAGTLVA